MKRLRATLKLIVALLPTIANLVALASCQNLYTFTTTINISSTPDYSWLQPTNTTISISQETTTYLPTSTTVQPREILDSAETGFPNRRSNAQYRRDKGENNDPEGPADHVIPYSVHEDPGEVPTRPKYVAPGLWAKPPPNKDIPLDFVPTKLHAQVRGTETVRRLPQKEAIQSAETDEEKENAHRLRQVVTNSKVNTVYTEEGYEDSAYDHAGHIRDADYHEGFARKLHAEKEDKKGSWSGKGKKEKHRKLEPDEFDEYNEDYQDHLEESRKRENTLDKDTLKAPEVNPKFAVANSIRALAEEIERDAEEAERNASAYQREQESKRVADSSEADSSESKEAYDEGDLKDEENKLIASKRGKKAKARAGKSNSLNKSSTKASRQSGEKRENGVNSEIDPDAPASPRGFVTNPINSQLYSIDQTTLKYIGPTSQTAFQRLDEPTTINYSQLLLDYFKMTRTESPIALLPNSTALNPLVKENSPVAVATIDGQGPYLLVKNEETSTLPSAFFGTQNFHPQNLFPNNIDFDSSSIQGQSDRLPGQNDDVNHIDGVGNLIASSTVATFSSVQPLLLQPLHSTSIENTEYSSTTLFEDIESTPTVMTLNFTEEAYSRMDNYQANPFLEPILDKSNIAVTRNKLKYRVLVRPTPKIPVKPRRQQSSTRQDENEGARIGDELSTKYTKILDYIKNKHKIKPLVANKKIVLPGDLTLLKPPVPHQRAVHPIFPTSRPIAKHSSVSMESESLREPSDWRSASRDQHRSFRPTDPPYRVNPSVIIVQPVKLTYRKNVLPVTKLLPPPPLPLPPPIASIAYRSGWQHNDYLSHIPGKTQQQEYDNTLRLSPLIPETSWRTRSRRKRSEEDVTNKTSVTGAKNNESAEKLTKRKRYVSQDRGRSSKNSEGSGTQDKDHEGLLNESPKISGDVIDREIAARFNETKNTNETSTEDEGEGEVEVDVPDFDYVEELAEDSPAKTSTTTETSIDTKKYPFYKNENVPVASALKYVVDPRTIPRKTSRGMEFYDSRNAYKQCDEVDPDLADVLPEKEEPDAERGPRENHPRLRGLGDKLDCFKAKYFDDNPLDSPLFAEKSVEEPPPPTELDPVKFASKVLLLPEESDDYVVHRVSKKPERNGRQWRGRKPQFETHESIRVNYRQDPKTGRGRNAYLHTVRGSKPIVSVRRVKNRRYKPKNSTTATSPKPRYQTESYQNQVYEDVMGNIRNMASNGYEVYEVTTMPPDTQIQTQIQTASSENAPKIAEDTPDLSAEKNTTDNVANVTSSNAMSEIKGLVPPPKYLTPRRLTNYRKYSSLGKNRVSVLRVPTIPRIIAHHHAIKLSKRSANSSENTTNEDKEKTTKETSEMDTNGNDTITETTTTTIRTNSTPTSLDLEIEESRLVSRLSQSPLPSSSKRKNSTSDELESETPPKTVYTIRDRIRYSRPKLDARGFGKFSTTPKTTDADSRRKEPRYNYFMRKKPVADPQVNYTIPIIDNISAIRSTRLLAAGKGSGTTEIYNPEESVMHRSAYGRRIKHPEEEETENVENVKSEESLEEEEEEEKEKNEEENVTNMYRVREDVNEDALPPRTKLTDPLSSKEILSFQEYLEAHPPGYEEAFPEEVTTPSNENRGNIKYKAEDGDEKQNDENDHSENMAVSSEDTSSENAEEQIQTPVKTKKKMEDDSSEDSSSKEEEGSKEDRTSSKYTTQPSSIEDNKDDERPEKTTSYRSYPFKRYKSMIKKGRHKDNTDSEEEEDEETKGDYAFSWRDDKDRDKKWRLDAFHWFEYPWERRERLARERKKRRLRAKKLRELYTNDENEDEDEDEDEEEEEEEEEKEEKEEEEEEEEEEKKESKRRERPIYPWERYNVPAKSHVNTRRHVSPQNTDDSDEEFSSGEVKFAKYSSRYSAANTEPTVKPSTALQIGRSIKKLLEDDSAEKETSSEKTSEEVKDRTSPTTQRSSSTSRGISRGTLVPEDVTQPPRRKSGRGKISRYDKNISSSSRLNSKKLRSEEPDDEDGTEKEQRVKDYLKLNKSNLEDSGPQAETASSQVSVSTRKIIPPTSPPHKKRRRVIPKSNSTITVDNAPAATSNGATKRRRKSQVLAATSAVPSPNADLKTSKSDFANLRRSYSTVNGTAKTNRSSSEQIPGSISGTIKDDSAKVETSTPKTRTIEHRSRVSKERIITKTTYPGETENFDAARNVTFGQEEPIKKLKIKVSRRKSNGKLRHDSDHNPIDNERDETRYFDQLQGDDIEKSIASKKPDAINSLKALGMRKEEVKMINNFSAFDGNVNKKDDSDYLGDTTPSETYTLINLMNNTPPRHINDHVKKRKKQVGEEKKDDEVTAEGSKLSSQAKFIKDPSRRLYYYLESK